MAGGVAYDRAGATGLFERGVGLLGAAGDEPRAGVVRGVPAPFAAAFGTAAGVGRMGCTRTGVWIASALDGGAAGGGATTGGGTTGEGATAAAAGRGCSTSATLKERCFSSVSR